MFRYILFSKRQNWNFYILRIYCTLLLFAKKWLKITDSYTVSRPNETETFWNFNYKYDSCSLMSLYFNYFSETFFMPSYFLESLNLLRLWTAAALLTSYSFRKLEKEMQRACWCSVKCYVLYLKKCCRLISADFNKYYQQLIAFLHFDWCTLNIPPALWEIQIVLRNWMKQKIR